MLDIGTNSGTSINDYCEVIGSNFLSSGGQWTQIPSIGFVFSAAIDNNHVIAGVSEAGTLSMRAVFTSATATTSLDHPGMLWLIPGGPDSAPGAAAINDSNVIVGYTGDAYLYAGYNSPTSPERPLSYRNAFYTTDKGIATLGSLGGKSVTATGISNNGVIVGYSTLAGEIETHAFRYANSVTTDLGTLGGGKKVTG